MGGVLRNGCAAQPKNKQEAENGLYRINGEDSRD